MASLETQKLDSIIASRRSVLMGGAAAAATALVGSKAASATTIPATPGDSDILNFALNLEYLEAQYYTLATEGVTADKAASNPITINGVAGVGGVAAGVTPTYAPLPAVPFLNQELKAFAFELALEERKHVNLIKGALGSAAVAQPALNLMSSFATIAGSANFPAPALATPFSSGLGFLLGASVFEDVGVTAYHGGAAYLSKANLTTGVQIHATEAQHAGAIRSFIYSVDQGLTTVSGGGVGTAATQAGNIAHNRATADGTYQVNPTDAYGLTGQDDWGYALVTVPLNGTPQTATKVMDARPFTTTTTVPAFYIGYARTLVQVLNVVYLTGGTAPAPTANGFFPSGLNGTIY